MARKLTQPFAPSHCKSVQYLIRRSDAVNYIFYSQIPLVLCWVYERLEKGVAEFIPSVSFVKKRRLNAN